MTQPSSLPPASASTRGLSGTIAWTDTHGTAFAIEGGITVSAQAASFMAALGQPLPPGTTPPRRHDPQMPQAERQAIHLHRQKAIARARLA